jgi:hypothetical protein
VPIAPPSKVATQRIDWVDGGPPRGAFEPDRSVADFLFEPQIASEAALAALNVARKREGFVPFEPWDRERRRITKLGVRAPRWMTWAWLEHPDDRVADRCLSVCRQSLRLYHWRHAVRTRSQPSGSSLRVRRTAFFPRPTTLRSSKTWLHPS